MDIQRKEIGLRLSEAVIHQKTIYLAGQVADAGCSPDVYEQTRQVLANIDRLLALSGSDKVACSQSPSGSPTWTALAR